MKKRSEATTEPTKEKAPARIDLTKCQETIVDKYLAQFELKVKPASDGVQTLDEKVRVLQDYQRKNTKPKKKLSTPCTVCGGVSNLDMPECPFCGDVEIAEKPVVAPLPVAAGEPLEEAAEAATSTEVVAHEGQIIAKGALGDLEAAEQRVKEAKENGVASYWELGRAFLDIYAGNLWKHRLTVDGKPVFKSWGQYIQGEHGMSAKHALDILEAAQNFDRDTFIAIGITRLRSIVRYEGAERDKLLEMAKDKKLPRAKLMEYIVEHPPEQRATRTQDVVGSETEGGKRGGFRGGAAAAQKGTETAKKVKDARRIEKEAPKISKNGEVTAIMLLGRQRIALYTKKDQKKRAMTMQQEPFAVFTHPNGLEESFQLIREAKGITLIRTVKRVDEVKPSAA